MSRSMADVVICGAGISGISVAYYLAMQHGITDIVLVDEREPLSFTSDKSAECYRNWWPGPGDSMVRFMNRSIDLLEDLAYESDNYFGMSRRGYAFLTAVPSEAKRMAQAAKTITDLGAGPLRVYNGRSDDPPFIPTTDEGFASQPTGADLILDPDLIQTRYPFITQNAIAMLHARRCGWLSAQQLGMYLLGKLRQMGVRLVRGRLANVDVVNGRVADVTIDCTRGMTEQIQTRTFVNCAGPFINNVAQLMGLDLPVFNELHAKFSLKDSHNIIPRDVPLMVWNDPVHLHWSNEERAELAADDETRWLTELFPTGVHFRPEGFGESPILLMIWTYHIEPQAVVWPPKFDPEYPEIVMRGLVNMVPRLKPYIERMEKPWIDGGYYCKTQENRPLITPLPIEGAWLYGAVSGFGIMASQAGGELLAAHIAGSSLPTYAPAFLLSRYEDSEYQKLLKTWSVTSGQL